jgi:hypothetical protein
LDALILVVVAAGGRRAVVPRRMVVETRPGTGRLHLPASPPLDAQAVASFGNAWAAAKALAGRDDADLHLSFAGATPLQGASAGLSLGLASLSLLLGGDALPPHFATGGVSTPQGDLEGGRSAAEKAEAAAVLAPQRRMRDPVFLCPPLVRLPEAPPLRVLAAADLGSAYARLHPGGAPRIAERHRALRRAEGVPLPPGWVEVAEGGLVLWRTRAPDDGVAMAGVRALARRGSALAP